MNGRNLLLVLPMPIAKGIILDNIEERAAERNSTTASKRGYSLTKTGILVEGRAPQLLYPKDKTTRKLDQLGSAHFVRSDPEATSTVGFNVLCTSGTVCGHEDLRAWTRNYPPPSTPTKCEDLMSFYGGYDNDICAGAFKPHLAHCFSLIARLASTGQSRRRTPVLSVVAHPVNLAVAPSANITVFFSCSRSPRRRVAVFPHYRRRRALLLMMDYIVVASSSSTPGSSEV
ncbi:hypothetical protein PIB30_065588 [Stylosanthes scabra]|uniref:Uncharacterized protein n=1 Tax=Stylosanthes scabra TaxID=79078 RepID=A0ABU6YLH0_9FABA|nr:hypothetical protein [Stylosanthes scabra]